MNAWLCFDFNIQQKQQQQSLHAAVLSFVSEMFKNSICALSANAMLIYPCPAEAALAPLCQRPAQTGPEKAGICAADLRRGLGIAFQYAANPKRGREPCGHGDMTTNAQGPGITESAGAALLSEPGGVNIQLASLWAHSQQNGTESRPLKNIIMACKMRRAKEDVCCISCGKYSLHVWSGFIRPLTEDTVQKTFCRSRFGSLAERQNLLH